MFIRNFVIVRTVELCAELCNLRVIIVSLLKLKNSFSLTHHIILNKWPCKILNYILQIATNLSNVCHVLDDAIRIV